MGIHLARVFASAVDQMSAQAKNLDAVRLARVKRQREDEMYDLTKQKAELGLKEKSLKNDGTAIQNQTQKTLMDEYFKQQDAINKGKDAQIDQTEHQVYQQGEQAKGVAKTILQNSPEVQSMVAQRLNPGLTSNTPPADMSQYQGADYTQQNANGSPAGGIDQAQESDGPEAVPSSFEDVPATRKKIAMDSKGKFGLKDQKASGVIEDRISKLKSSGAPLLPEEQYFDYRNSLQKQGIKYNRGEVLRQAKSLAKQTAGEEPVTPSMIADQIPEAETALYGKSFKDHVGGDEEGKNETTPEQDADTVNTNDKKSEDNSRVKVKKDGKTFTLPKSQLDEAKKQGYILVN